MDQKVKSKQQTIVKYTAFEHCSACLSKNITEVFDMPNFSQIGIYLDAPDDEGLFPTVNQGLTICDDCGHIQLRNAVDPAFLYDENFTHRTSESCSAMESNTEFSHYIKKLTNGRRFKRVIEVGCNDAFFLKTMLDISDVACGIDPVWKGREEKFTEDLTDEEASRIKVVGDFVENVDFDAKLGGKPDLIVSSFVFEHIKEPVDVIKAMMEVCDDDALFVIKVPGTDMLLDNCRFDQLSHQHYQQFTLDSFRTMIETAGGVYVDHMVYYQVWGAIMMAFKKGQGKGPETSFRRANLEMVRESKRRFDSQLENCLKAVECVSDRKIYGLGAAQNFPTLAYFMKDVSFLECIIDDNPSRQNKYFPGISVPTSAVRDDMDFEESAILLTGPDYGRALIARARELNARQVILPFNVL